MHFILRSRNLFVSYYINFIIIIFFVNLIFIRFSLQVIYLRDLVAAQLPRERRQPTSDFPNST